jgi:hypothetical protein
MIHDIVWQEGDGDPRHRAPFALLVKFDNYSGLGLLQTGGDDVHVPIPAVLQVLSWSRSQFLVMLAYAILDGVSFEEPFDFDRFRPADCCAPSGPGGE